MLASWLLFLPAFFVASITPGMCMTLSMTMGMAIGVRRTFFMMAGELFGVALVAFICGLGAAKMMSDYPAFFAVFKYLGGGYLCFLGIQLWLSKGKMAALPGDVKYDLPGWNLAMQGFATAIFNPKGWAFFAALLPPFIDGDLPLIPQLAGFLSVVVAVEFFCLTLYANGGNAFAKLLKKGGNIKTLNRLSGTMMIAVGFWLAFG